MMMMDEMADKTEMVTMMKKGMPKGKMATKKKKKKY